VKEGSGDFIRELREAVSVAETVGEYVNLRKQGTSLVGLCPFHAERSPSFSVSEKKKAFYCFGCQKGGDVFDFIQEMQGVSFPEAVRILADRAGKAVPPQFRGRGGQGGQAPEPGKAAADKARLELVYKLNRFVAQFYHERLMGAAGQEARDYLRKRGITDETMKAWFLGYAPDDWALLTEFLSNKKAPLDVAEKLGLIRRKDTAGPDGRAHFDLFRGRVMFPISDRRGLVTGFGGRAMGDATPKYLNSPDSEIFSKSEQMYGIFQAQKHIREKNICVIVEGYMDCLALHQAGFGYAVATLGTALTDNHVAKLSRITTNIVALFDGDRAGQAAQLKAMEAFLAKGLVIRGATLPTGKDPDEYIQEHGAAAMEELLKHAPDLLDLNINRLKSEAAGRTEARAQALEKILTWVALLRTDTARMLRLQDLEAHFGVPYSRLQEQIRAKTPSRPHTPQAPRPRAPGPVRVLPLPPEETRFLEFLISYPTLVMATEGLDQLSEALKDPRAREGALLLLSRIKVGKIVDISILDEVMSPDLRRLMSQWLAVSGEEFSGDADPERKKEWDDLVKKIGRTQLETEKNKLREEMRQAESLGNFEDVARLLAEQARIQKAKEL
jgi:DNA primase